MEFYNFGFRELKLDDFEADKEKPTIEMFNRLLLRLEKAETDPALEQFYATSLEKRTGLKTVLMDNGHHGAVSEDETEKKEGPRSVLKMWRDAVYEKLSELTAEKGSVN